MLYKASLKIQRLPPAIWRKAKPLKRDNSSKSTIMSQLMHNLSDDGIEYQIRDRFSFMRFLGLQLEDRVPDSKTVWTFREALKNLVLVDVLFVRFHAQLAEQGYIPGLINIASPRIKTK